MDYLGFGVAGVFLLFPFKVIGRKIVQCRVPAVRVVPALDPGKDSQACLGLGSPATSGNEFALQSRKKALHHGVVVGISDRSHGGTHAHLTAPIAKSDAGVLGGLNQSLQHLKQGGVV